jgi:hypothetical protein
MNHTEAQFQRTLVEVLIEYGYNDIASIVLDCDVEFGFEFDPIGLEKLWTMVVFYVPINLFSLAKGSDRIEEKLTKVSNYVARSTGLYNLTQGLAIDIFMKLSNVSDDWQETARRIIVDSKNSNQGNITEKIRKRNGQSFIIYNEMKFASQTEVRVAQELELRKVLFFPLPLAVRADTGDMYQDHREPDFLVCQDGVWGVLEVSFHPGRYEKDDEKNTWFQKSGIPLVKSYTAEKCYKKTSEVVDEFLLLLKQYKR